MDAPTTQTPTAARKSDLVASGHDAFTSLQKEIDRVFDEFGRGFSRLSPLTPRMDVAETDKDIEITAELPGLEEKDVKVELAGDTLTISGEKKTESEHKDKNVWFSERNYGSFTRRLSLPQGVKAEDIKADLTKGVLKVTVAKPAATAAKTIEVKSA
ncbi:MAG TPA: Hsp20/alpha crystallin family protein [Caulobacteraceae bacterium]|nr:Hsp20/alpha crystallin family protein [Caulobacteraceae bacterium]